MKLRRKNSRSLEDVSVIGGDRSGRTNRWSNQINDRAVTDDVFMSSRNSPPVPASRTAKPRLGQSSLSRSGALPVSVSGSNLSASAVSGIGGGLGYGDGTHQQQQQQQQERKETKESSPLSRLQPQPQPQPRKQQQQQQLTRSQPSQPRQQQQQQQQQRPQHFGSTGSRGMSPQENPHLPRPALRSVSTESEEGPPPPPRQYRDQVCAEVILFTLFPFCLLIPMVCVIIAILLTNITVVSPYFYF